MVRAHCRCCVVRDPVVDVSDHREDKRSTVVSVRLNADELATLQEKATDAGLTLSGFLRYAAVNDAERDHRAERDLTIVVHREGGMWWAEIAGEPGYVATDATFDGLCERLTEGLHLLGLSRERAVFTVDWHHTAINGAAVNTSGQRVVVLREQAS